ncbi:MAG TPA: hypothetical protein VJT50_15970 [Pyrinomonadaceae bacterium]|nr:hypothetical protein [Pyrinomonadaceae bacterium]
MLVLGLCLLLFFIHPANYFDALGEALLAGAAGDAMTGAAVEPAGLATGDGCGVGVGVASGEVDCKTECTPVTAGNDNINAISMNAAAAPMVIFERMLAVPRGPKAVLETELENKSPAPDLPGCSKTTTIKMKHASMNSVYKR